MTVLPEADVTALRGQAGMQQADVPGQADEPAMVTVSRLAVSFG